MADNSRKVPLRTKLFYGVGSVAYGVKDNGFSFFLLLYYSQVLGLSPTLAGTALMLALLVDAISDPLVGYISDNWHSKWGRRHPFMYFAALPLAFTPLPAYILVFCTRRRRLRRFDEHRIYGGKSRHD